MDKHKKNKRDVKSNNVEPEEILIANPIYDHAFKYMMEDNDVARRFISTIIGEEVIELTFAPQEYVNQKKKKKDTSEKDWNYYRLDFMARIRTNERLKAVMIEVQKISVGTDIIRFRRYLGGQYQNQIQTDGDDETAIPIYCIFVIGDGIGVEGIPVLKINPDVENAATGRKVQTGYNEFIESLHHRSWIVQVPELKNRSDNEMETLLSIFDQTKRAETDRFKIKVQQELFPEKCRPIIRRLKVAASDDEVSNAMQAQDDFLKDLRKERAEKEIAIAERDAAVAEKDAAIAEKEAAIVAAIAKERTERDAAIAKERTEKDAAIAKERTEKDAAIAKERAEKEALRAELEALKKKVNS
jgi:hypothetical protein